MEQLQPLLSSQPTDSSFSYSQQQQVKDDEMTIAIMKKEFQDCGTGDFLPDTCIYRVPVTLRHLNEKAYTPQVVSIGPFHHGNKRLQDMERHKRTLFKRFIQRAMSSLDDLFRFVKQFEPRIRKSYSEIFNLNEQQLVKMTLMDAGFIIQLFIMDYEKRDLRNDAKLSQNWLRNSIVDDLILLENQLPFFIIEELFNKAFPHGGNLPPFLTLTYEYFEYYNLQKLEPNPYVNIRHFTDLIRLFYWQEKVSGRHSFEESENDILLYSANELQEAGIKLKAVRDKRLLDLTLSGHVLEIPQFHVEDRTETLFRNMIALEQCHYPDDAYITDYAVLLDYLINTSKDVDLLVKNKIVSNLLGDANDVALLCNGLCKNLIQENFNYDIIEICQSLNSYCEHWWHKMKATLRRDYCRTPWQTAASVAGILLLLLTIVQTICSILQVVN